MQVTIFKNITTEKNPSMHIYAQELLKNMPSNVKDFSIRANKLPIFKYYLEKEFIYPLVAARHQADVNHISDQSYCGLLKAIDPDKTVVTCHDLTPLLYPKTVSAAGRIRYWHNVKLLPRAKRIITVSDFSRKSIMRFFGNSIAQRIKVIPNGVSDIFKPAAISKEALKNKYRIKDKAILHVGKAYKHKNIDILLEFLRMHPEIQLVKVGPLLNSHARYIKQHRLDKQIMHFPFMDLYRENNLTEIYNCVDAIVMPSLFEGFGLPILEALACGCPVICSDIPPFHEVAAGAAIFFDPLDLKSLEKCINDLFNGQTLRVDLIKKGFEIAKDYNWKKCACETYKIYEEIYNENKKAGITSK